MRRLIAPLLGLVLVVTTVSTVSTATALGASPASAASAAAPAATELVLVANAGYSDATVAVGATLTSGGAPVPGRPVDVQRRVGGAWSTIATTDTDSAGRVLASATRSRVAADNVFRARTPGDATYAAGDSGPVVSALQRRASEVTLRAPASVVAGRRAGVSVTWRTAEGQAVAGVVVLQRRGSKGGWARLRSLTTDASGAASAKVGLPAGARTTRLRVVAPTLDWVRGDRSPVRSVRTSPPGDPVRLPRGAPRPRITLPAQPAATGRGAAPVITPIPDAVWDDMVGVSWHEGCPVGRAGLRLLRINYWGFDGYRHRGELVAATSAVDNMARALTAMHRAELPIRAMYRVDRFGYSARLGGGDDYASMAADNTSAFNCRSVVNRPGVRSPHATGRALDVNTWENPYLSATGPVPNTWWVGRSHPRVAWRTASHPVVRTMARQGLRWTYGAQDSQHFDVATASGRVLAPRAACGPAVCH